MKENNKNRLTLEIILGLLIVLIIGISSFIIYDKVLHNDNNNEQKENNGNNEINQQELNYTISDSKITINNKEVDITGTSIEVVGKLNDVLIVKVWSFDFYDYYVVDKNANVVLIFIGTGATSSNDYKKIFLKGAYPGECIIENNNLIIKSDIVRNDPTYVTCNAGDDYIVEYTEQFAYLGNGDFSESRLIKITTSKEYQESNSIKCQ